MANYIHLHDGEKIMFNLSLKPVFVLFLCLAVAPGYAAPAGAADGNIHPVVRIVGLVWDTAGGGDMKFLIKRDGPGYQIRVKRFNFKTMDKVLALTAANDDVLQLVDHIFAKEIDLYDYSVVPQGVTGTWTSITLVCSDGSEVKIDQIKAAGSLHILYDFVQDALRSL